MPNEQERVWWKNHLVQAALALPVAILAGLFVAIQTDFGGNEAASMPPSSTTIDPVLKQEKRESGAFLYDIESEEYFADGSRCYGYPCSAESRIIKSKQTILMKSVSNKLNSLNLQVPTNLEYLDGELEISVQQTVFSSDPPKLIDASVDREFIRKMGFIRLKFAEVPAGSIIMISVDRNNRAMVFDKPYATVHDVEFIRKNDVLERYRRERD